MEVVVDQMKIVSIDKEGKIYDKVSRAELESERMRAILDYHSILLPLKPSDILDIIIYKGDVEDNNVPREYEYLMLGKCYKHVKDDRENTYHISFGGLLLQIQSSTDIDLCDFDNVGFACKRL